MWDRSPKFEVKEGTGKQVEGGGGESNLKITMINNNEETKENIRRRNKMKNIRHLFIRRKTN